MVLGANLRATSNIACSRQIRSAMRPALRMAGEQPKQVIDFGKVGFADADNQVCTLTYNHKPIARYLSVSRNFPVLALFKALSPRGRGQFFA